MRPNPEQTLASPWGQHKAAAVAGNAPLYSGTPHPSTWAQSVRKKMRARMRKYSYKAVQIIHLTDFQNRNPNRSQPNVTFTHCGKLNKSRGQVEMFWTSWITKLRLKPKSNTFQTNLTLTLTSQMDDFLYASSITRQDVRAAAVTDKYERKRELVSFSVCVCLRWTIMAVSFCRPRPAAVQLGL